MASSHAQGLRGFGEDPELLARRAHRHVWMVEQQTGHTYCQMPGCDAHKAHRHVFRNGLCVCGRFRG